MKLKRKLYSNSHKKRAMRKVSEKDWEKRRFEEKLDDKVRKINKASTIASTTAYGIGGTLISWPFLKNKKKALSAALIGSTLGSAIGNKLGKRESKKRLDQSNKVKERYNRSDSKERRGMIEYLSYTNGANDVVNYLNKYSK